MKILLRILPFVILVFAGCSKTDQSYNEKVAMEHEGDAPVSNAAWHEPVTAVDTSEVTYAKVNGEEITGYLAVPEDAPDGLPGLIVIHEWWGLNDNIKMMTRRLAAEGYTALAVDLYGDKVASSPDKAREYVMEAMNDMESSVANLKAAHQYLAGQHQAGKVGSIGWCFGGGMSLNTALALPDEIDATVIYYGRLVTDPDKLSLLEMPILGIFGEEDSSIPVSQVNEFESTLDSLKKEVQVHIYEGAGHAFANPSGTRYQKEAAEDAWEKTTAFLDYYLKAQ